MSYTPPDPFQHNTSSSSNIPSHHTRQSSLPTVYEVTTDNDPYRIHKKSPRLGSISDNSSSDLDATLSNGATQQQQFHSRTASDSSTSKLYGGEQARANSYLPYSHHTRDPNQPQNLEPLYIDSRGEGRCTSSLGVNSMLQQDNYMIDQLNNKKTTSTIINDLNKEEKQDYTTADQMLSAAPLRRRKKKKKGTCCGYIRYRTLAVLIFIFTAIIVVIWYFVWPRVPNLILDDIDNIGTIQVITNTTDKSMSTTWRLNLTADNTNNWVPTRISSIDLFITDDKTQQQFGNGTKGFFILPPRKKSNIEMDMSIYYESSNTNDSTFQDLYNACGVQVTSNIPSLDNQQDVLNVTLHVLFHISGIAWSTTRLMPIQGLVCPTS